MGHKINQTLSSLPKAQCFKVGDNKSMDKDISDKCKQKESWEKGASSYYQVR